MHIFKSRFARCSTLDESTREGKKLLEDGIRCIVGMVGEANAGGNAMVQNHLANHFLTKWAQQIGTVGAESSNNRTFTSSQPTSGLKAGDIVRIGPKFETKIDQIVDKSTFTIVDSFKPNDSNR